MVMPPAAAVCGIMSWEEEEGACVDILRRERGRKAMGKENNTEVDGELVVNHVIRRK